MQTLIDGLTIGSLYGLAAIGLNILYRPSHVFNFAQGDLVLLGALGSFVLIQSLHVPWVVSLLCIVVLGALAGGLEERIGVRPILRRGSRATGWILTTLAFSLIIEDFIGRYVGEIPSLVAPMPGLSVQPFHVGPLALQSYQIAVWILAWLMVGLISLAYRTKHGRAALALAEDSESAMVRGVPASAIVFGSWVIGGAFAMFTGLVAAPITFASIGLGATLLIKGFEAAAIGGLGDNRGAMVGGIVVGVVESFAAIALSPGFRDAATFAVLLAVLLIRPTGLFGQLRIREVYVLLAPARIELLRPTPTRAVIVAALILAAAVPLVNEGQYLFVACTVAIYVLAAIGMNVLHGYAGQISLGQGAMVAIGAYTTGILTVKEGWTFWPTVGVAIAVAIAIGVVMSLPALRMGSWYLAMVTLIMASLVQEFLLEAEGLTNGGAGIIGIPQVPGFDPSEPLSLTQLYYLMIGVIVALTWLCWNLSRSPFGRALLAVKESEVGAQAIGIGIARSKIFAYVVSAITGAIAGSFWAGLNGVVTPDEFDISLSVFILLAVLLGGEGRLASPVLGSILLFALPQLMTGLAQWRLLVYGLLLLVLALFAPFGLTGLAVSAWDRIRGVRRRPQRVVPAWVASEGEAGPGTHLSAILGSAGGNGTGAYELDVCDVSVSFGGNHAVVRASMHVPGGTIHGLIGPNGSGKTTMLNLISGYYPLKEGRITIAGVDASRRRATVIARQGVARTFQHPRLMDQETVLTNVLMGAFRLNQATLAEWLLRVGRSRQEERRNRADAMECLAFTRLDHLSEVRVNQLAHGQRRLVEVARALASRPRLLLLDEPAAGLPPDQVDRLSTLITEIRALDITVLIVEHHIEMVANLVDSVTVMNQGRVLADGPVREVIESPAVLAAYIGKIDALPNRTGSERSLR